MPRWNNNKGEAKKAGKIIKRKQQTAASTRRRLVEAENINARWVCVCLWQRQRSNHTLHSVRYTLHTIKLKWFEVSANCVFFSLLSYSTPKITIFQVTSYFIASPSFLFLSFSFAFFCLFFLVLFIVYGFVSFRIVSYRNLSRKKCICKNFIFFFVCPQFKSFSVHSCNANYCFLFYLFAIIFMSL